MYGSNDYKLCVDYFEGDEIRKKTIRGLKCEWSLTGTQPIKKPNESCGCSSRFHRRLGHVQLK